MLRDTSAASTSNRSTSAARAAGVNKTAPTRNKSRTTRRRTTRRRRIAAFIMAASSAISAKTRPQRPTRAADLVGDCTIRRKGDLDESPGLRRAFNPKLRVIGLGERLGQWQPKLGSAGARARPSPNVGNRLKRGLDLFFAH